MTNTVIDDDRAERPTPGDESTSGSVAAGAGERVPSGIEPLDERTGGLEKRGLHLLSSPPVPAREAFVLHFLRTGLDDDRHVALVTRTSPDRVIAAGERYGFPLEEAWRAERLRIVGFRGDHEVRLRRAASPEDVFVELASVLPAEVERIVFDPGAVLWEGRGDGSAASAFVDFVHETSATVLATTTRELDGGLSVASELVTQAASGVFELEEETGSLVRLTVRKLGAGRPHRSDVTLSLREGEGFRAHSGAPARRASDRPGAGSDRLLRLALDGPIGDELEDWLRDTYRVTEAEDPLDLVSRLQGDDPFGAVLISLDRGHLEEGRKACSVCRRLRPSIPAVVVSDEPFRASDRADLLRAGADECMTGTLNVEELASRLDLVRARGGGFHPGAASENDGRPGSSGASDGAVGSVPVEAVVDGTPPTGRPGGGPAGGDDRAGPIAEEAFRREIRRALADREASVFTVVRFSPENAGETADELVELIRTESGDFVGLLDGRAAAWLAGTAPSEAEGFLRRVREVVDVGSLDPEILGSVRDAGRLRELAG